MDPQMPESLEQVMTKDAERVEEKAKEGEIKDREELKRLQEEARKNRMDYLKSIEPTLPKKVDEWKAKYGRVDSVHIAGQLYIYRGLIRSEYLATMGAGLDKNKNDEKIASKCLLWPRIEETAWISMPAGVPMTISDLVLTASGFGTEDAIPVRL